MRLILPGIRGKKQRKLWKKELQGPYGPEDNDSLTVQEIAIECSVEIEHVKKAINTLKKQGKCIQGSGWREIWGSYGKYEPVFRILNLSDTN